LSRAGFAKRNHSVRQRPYPSPKFKNSRISGTRLIKTPWSSLIFSVAATFKSRFGRKLNSLSDLVLNEKQPEKSKTA